MRQQLWGRARWLWALQAAAVLCFAVVAVLADRPFTKLIALGFLVVRVVVAVLEIQRWRARQRESAVDDASRDRVVPPR